VVANTELKCDQQWNPPLKAYPNSCGVVYTACDRKKSQMELAEAALIIEVAVQSRYREILGALKLPLREWPLP
jgi:transcription initiation factor TFIIIB Brf1 subunit/transcription initiation factor TFIIB